jgi:hypothetical protein
MLLAALLAAAAAAVAAAAYDPELNWPNPRAGVLEQELSMAVDNRGRLLPVAAVNIFGLTRPVSVHWDVPPNGPPNILIAEKVRKGGGDHASSAHHPAAAAAAARR